MKANQKIRELLDAYGVRQWQLAEALGVSEATVYRLLRTELDDQTKEGIVKAVEAYAADQEVK